MTNNNSLNLIYKFTKSCWSLGILAVLFFFLSFVFSQFYTSSLGNKYEQNKFRDGIDQVMENMDELKLGLDNLPDDFVFFDNDILQKANDNNIQAFVFYNNSLTAWTDNDYLIDHAFDADKTYLEETDNAFVLVRDYVFPEYSLRLTFPLMTNYRIENEYLKNELNPVFGIIKNISLSANKNEGAAFYSLSGTFLFSGIWAKNNSPGYVGYSVLFVLYILAIVLLFAFFQQSYKKYLKTHLWRFISLTLSVLIVTIILQWLQWPSIIYQSDIFSPAIFASSFVFSSLGSLLLNSLASLFILISTLEFVQKRILIKFRNPKLYHLSYGAYLIFLFLLLILLKNTVSDLIFNSTISFDITQMISINYLSIFGLTALTIWVYAYYILIDRGHIFLEKQNPQHFNPWLSFSVVLGLSLLWTIFFENNDFTSFLFFNIIILVKLSIKSRPQARALSLTTLYLLGFSILLSFWLNTFNVENEQNKRKSIIQSLTINQDPQAEYLFAEISKSIYKDEFLKSLFQDINVNYDSISNYIESTYFKNHLLFDKYDFQTTICSRDLKLNIQPQNIEILCDTFFYENLIQFGSLTSNKNLYLLEYGTGQINYLGLLRFYQITDEAYIPHTVYMEINSKLKRKGFTRLFSQKDYDPFEKIANYSLATYENRARVEAYGSYAYPEHFSWNIDNTNLVFTDKNQYNHLIYKQSEDKIYVLSLKTPPATNKLTPFSYLFVFMGMLFIIFSYLSFDPYLKIKFHFGFAGRMQLTMVVIILISFAVITTITVFYIKELNENKNHHQLENLAIALQTEFEHKLANEADLSAVDPEYLNSLLNKFSKVFDTDINLYHLDGHLLSTTRSELFEYPLLSDLLNPAAFSHLRNEHQSLYIAKEKIGSLEYSSAYLPFHNKEGVSIAFINLPYFARVEVLRSEISSLLMTLMNVYTLIIVLSVLVILFVSNYISRPLTMLKEHLQKVSLGKENHKIQWQGIEEIDALVEEYNRMIDALALSSEKLAKSERESAWREMAKQVAHEIKNPLTPMKLSVQYMMRSYDSNEENNKEKIQSLSNTLIEQIDTLSDIATAFSDFANMPKSINEVYEISSIIKSAIALFNDEDSVNIQLLTDEKYWAHIDKNQWLRVFNNLIKNSIQAAENNKTILIEISLEQKDNFLAIQFCDNGRGIPEEMKDKIFVPNFTTKTKGAGLGLAMVRNIINNSNGSIRFESVANEGTCFFIELPLQSEL